VLNVILAAKPELNVKNNKGRTAIMMASDNDHADCIKALAASGADVNAADADGVNAVMLAARGHAGCLAALKAAGANLNAKDSNGNTALMDAAVSGNRECVRILIAGKADVNAKRADGTTALGLAKNYPGIISDLKAAGATQ